MFSLKQFDRKLHIKLFHYSILSLDKNVRGVTIINNYKEALNLRAKIAFPLKNQRKSKQTPQTSLHLAATTSLSVENLSPVPSSSCSLCFPLLPHPTSKCSRNAIHRAVILPAAHSICFHP